MRSPEVPISRYSAIPSSAARNVFSPVMKFRFKSISGTTSMPITMTIDHERREVDAVATGLIRYADVEKHILAERNFGGMAYKEFFDVRDAKLLFALSSAEIRQIVALVRDLS